MVLCEVLAEAEERVFIIETLFFFCVKQDLRLTRARGRSLSGCGVSNPAGNMAVYFL
jgi:hypothetical protein